MKKAVSLILCGLMIACTFCTGTAAADAAGTPIASEADFLDMKEDGNYYLNADITVGVTYEKIFTGTLDGNGHTVTVTVPMFNEFNGTVKNLTTAGELEGTQSHIAPIAVQSISGATVENCVNRANVTLVTEEKGACAAGFIAITRAQETDFINCENHGNVSCTITTEDNAVWGRAGGFVGASNAGQFTRCVNYGDVYVEGSDSAVGGFIGKAGDQNGMYKYTFSFCTNHGSIEGVTPGDGIYKGCVVAGFCGAAFGGGSVAIAEFYGCVNDGAIRGSNYVGGFVGYEHGNGSTGYGDFQYCVSAGDITVTKYNDAGGIPKKTWVSPFAAYNNTADGILSNSIVTAKIIVEDGAEVNGRAMVGCSGAMPEEYSGIYVVNPAGYDYLAVSGGAAVSVEMAEAIANGSIISVTEAQVISGEVAKMINKAEGLVDGYMFDEAANTAYPLPVAGSRSQQTTDEATTAAQDDPTLPTDTTDSPEATTASPEDITTSPEASGSTAAPETAPSEKKGCGSSVCAAAMLASLAAAAFVFGKKER